MKGLERMSQKPQVMVVDDDLAMCGFLRTFLGARGYDALTVTNADEAVRRFHAERPAAVLLDVVMPGSMDGLAALAAFKKIDQDVPVIVISGQGAHAHRRAGDEARRHRLRLQAVRGCTSSRCCSATR